MKNLYFFTLLSAMLAFSSCGSMTGGDDQDLSSCDSGNGYISADISESSDYRLDCAIGSVSEILDVKVFVVINFDVTNPTANSITYKNYLAIGAGLPSNLDSGCESDYLDDHIGSVTYFENITIKEGESLDDHPGKYNSDEDSIDICFDILTAEKAKGTFSGVLHNYEGKEKYISDGEFEFEF
ncbi:MAG: hypothetical protein ACJATI_000703 [Halioglobus sp.]|jgi:hypothetical protein